MTTVRLPATVEDWHALCSLVGLGHVECSPGTRDGLHHPTPPPVTSGPSGALGTLIGVPVRVVEDVPGGWLRVVTASGGVS